MERIISQIYLLPTLGRDHFKQEYLGLMPCDGRYLLSSKYGALFHLIGGRYGSKTENADAHNETPTHYFALPKLESPLEEYTYYICVDGTFPQFK